MKIKLLKNEEDILFHAWTLTLFLFLIKALQSGTQEDSTVSDFHEILVIIKTFLNTFKDETVL